MHDNTNLYKFYKRNIKYYIQFTFNLKNTQLYRYLVDMGIDSALNIPIFAE